MNTICMLLFRVKLAGRSEPGSASPFTGPDPVGVGECETSMPPKLSELKPITYAKTLKREGIRYKSACTGGIPCQLIRCGDVHSSCPRGVGAALWSARQWGTMPVHHVFSGMALTHLSHGFIAWNWCLSSYRVFVKWNWDDTLEGLIIILDTW